MTTKNVFKVSHDHVSIGREVNYFFSRVTLELLNVRCIKKII